MRFIYKSCSWLTKLAFYLQTVHLILQTCISLTIVAIHFSNVASHFTIKHIILDFVLKSNPLMQKLKKKFQLLEPSLKDEGHLRSTGDALLLKRIIRAVCCADDHGHGQQKERETYQH